MKLLFATLALLFTLFSCNIKDKKKETKAIIKTKITDPKPTKKPQNQITKNFVLGKFDYKTDTTFIKVDKQYAAKTLYLKKEAYTSFLKMYNAAKQDNIKLIILSGTRNFEEQKVIWERKWERYSNQEPLLRAKMILEYSSMPSSSRHHWGTDLDLNNLSNSYFSSKEGKSIYNWLVENANDYGFYQVYTDKDNERTGYNIEKWHWSYLPLANTYLEYYNQNVTLNDIKGFKGYKQAKGVDIINSYVNGISKKIKEHK
ncbi:M15 family metallopeptidase [Winogradskyella undariae]|uniref:M15 family metallopeptidase n=1 Tax=Winogradskyella undariae TaxID=1285465 RepID=UPI0015CD7C2E|nr:M15 family metallopeptidase [Winogradskyella undariae]